MVHEVHLPPDGLRPVLPRSEGMPAGARTSGAEGTSFQAVLEEKLAGVRFSAHAEQRLASRNIHLSPGDLARLNEGVNRAQAKGARQSLILVEDLAFLVSIPNRTVVTAVNDPAERGAVFSQIDSAVFV